MISLERLLGHVWIVGTGRLGLALGGQLAKSGRLGRISFTGRSPIRPEHPVFSRDEARYVTDLPAAGSSPTLIIIAVPDAEIGEVADLLAKRGLERSPVLHTSGVLNADVLASLADSGHPTGSIHPLVAIADPTDAADRLIGAWFGVDGSADAIEAAAIIVGLLKGAALRVDPSMRPSYHAAAVFASNYVVVLLATAEELFLSAGVSAKEARVVATTLARSAIDAVEASSPTAALTGPVSRGDDTTVALHLRGLSPDLRPLYSELARVALRLARSRGLDSEAGTRILDALEAGTN